MNISAGQILEMDNEMNAVRSRINAIKAAEESKQQNAAGCPQSINENDAPVKCICADMKPCPLHDSSIIRDEPVASNTAHGWRTVINSFAGIPEF